MAMQSLPNRGNKRNGSSNIIINSNDSNQTGLIKIAMNMINENISESFVIDVLRLAFSFEGIAGLMKLWKDEDTQEERDEIIADLQDMIDACMQKEKTEEFYVKFNDLDTIAKNIRLFKDSLLYEVEMQGGINKLSSLTEIPQPSLSRFFNSNSMPQRSTLIKIAKALDLDELKMDSFWNKDKRESKNK